MRADGFRFGSCNESFEKTPFPQVCRTLKALGYQGIEIAPFTLGALPREMSAATRQELVRVMADEGIEFIGLHWLMVGPTGLHVTTADESVRARSWEYVGDLVELCGDLGGGLMIFGSPKQRATTPGVNRAKATRNYVEGLAKVAPKAEARNVTILVEALPLEQCDVVTTLAEAAGIVREINSPAIRTMFDTHNSTDETEPAEVLVERYFDIIRHIHLNEMDGKHPGQGDYDFRTLLGALERLGYEGWVSMEPMDFAPGGERIARETIEYLKAL